MVKKSGLVPAATMPTFAMNNIISLQATVTVPPVPALFSYPCAPDIASCVFAAPMSNLAAFAHLYPIFVTPCLFWTQKLFFSHRRLLFDCYHFFLHCLMYQTTGNLLISLNISKSAISSIALVPGSSSDQFALQQLPPNPLTNCISCRG
jgi:hypothetical protein